MAKMNTLVTGGLGFIGSHLVDRLLTDGHRVTVIDNVTTGRFENLAHLDSDADLCVINQDVADSNRMQTHFDGIDWVFHLAALADVVPSVQRPMSYHNSNVDGTIATLEASRIHGVKRFIYMASSSCYGIPDVYPTPETAPISPQYPYALTKYVGEEYVLHWGQVYGLPVVSLRLFNAYGPRSRTSGTYGAVFGVFLAQKLSGQAFTVVGDGTQTRDFTYVTDVANACVLAAESELDGEVLNLGAGEPQSINRLTELLGGQVVHIPKRPGEPDCTHADTTKIFDELGWEPEVKFEEGVEVLMDNIEYWRDAPVWTPGKIESATRDWFRFLSR